MHFHPVLSKVLVWIFISTQITLKTKLNEIIIIDIFQKYGNQMVGSQYCEWTMTIWNELAV